MLIAACNALGLYLPVKKVEESRLENTRPDGWIISAGIFACHLDFLLPYRKHVLIYFDTRVHSNELSSPRLISIYDNEDVWIDAFSKLEQAGSPFGGSTASSPLSQREKDVLRLIAEGLTAKEIADRLGISANTVVTHRKNITGKLGIRSASGLSLYALMNGLI